MKQVKNIYFKKCGLAGIRTRNIRTLTGAARSYATIILHTKTCFTLQRKHSRVRSICTAKCFFTENAPDRSFAFRGENLEPSGLAINVSQGETKLRFNLQGGGAINK